MMKRLFLCALIAGLSFICAIVEGADWIFLGGRDTGTIYYDRSSIAQLSKNVIRVSVKCAYSYEGAKAVREIFPNVNKSETISYTLYVYDIDCSADSFSLIKAATYNSAESVIEGTELDLSETGQSTLEHITPHSRMEQLAGAACRWKLYDR
jgi:hypothetical protein